MNIVDGNENKVGWIYFKYYTRDDDGRYCVFLEDLLIFESERRKGFASAALREMNELARQDGCASSVLFVWDHNPGGMRLYEKCGYRPYNREEGGTYMVKELCSGAQRPMNSGPPRRQLLRLYLLSLISVRLYTLAHEKSVFCLPTKGAFSMQPPLRG